MRWRLFLVVVVAMVGVGACTHVSASPAVTKPLPASLSTEALTDYPVVSRDGVEIGRVDGIVFDTQTGGARYVVVLIKDIYNFGKGAVNGPEDQYLPIPWSHLKLASDNRHLVVDADAGFVKAAPVLYQAPDTTTQGWDKSVQTYWLE